MSTPSTRNPLAPLEFVLALVTGLFVLLLPLFAGAAIFGSGSMTVSNGRISSDVCLALHNGHAATVDDRVVYPAASAEPAPGERVLPAGTSVNTKTLSVCARKPTSTERLVATGAPVLQALLMLMVPVALAWRITRIAKTRGIFSAPVARSLSFLGAWVLGASVVCSLVTMLAMGWLLDRLLPGSSGSEPIVTPSWAVVFTGFGLLALGRVFANGVVMQDELDATV